MIKRYLITFSYNGSYFKASPKVSKDTDLTTAVGALETALQFQAKRLQIDLSPLTLSSRTDAGVHAHQNTAHVDLSGNTIFCIKDLMRDMNKFLFKKWVPLRILDVRQVSNEFNARKFAAKRSYLYRLAAPKDNNAENAFIFPISEFERCYFLREPLRNVELVKQVMSLFPGTRDFTSFCGRPTHQEGRTFIRHLDLFDIYPGKPLINPLYDPLCAKFDYWDIVAEGASFVYRQVRRMVSAALAVAQGRLTVEDVKDMLDSPKPQSTLKYRLVPAYGLYLTNLSYDDKFLSVDWKRSNSSGVYTSPNISLEEKNLINDNNEL